MRISVWESRELQAAILGLKRAERAISGEVTKQTRRIALPEWQKAVAERAETRLEHRVLVATARVKVSTQNVVLSSATVGRKLSGGFNPKTDYYAAEWGGQPNEATFNRTSRRGNVHKVTRNTRAQLRPRRKAGYVVMPAARNMIPRIASLWVQTVVRTFHEAIEGK